MNHRHSFRSDRRRFLLRATTAGVAALVLPRRAFAVDSLALSRVIIVDDASATNGNAINTSVVQAMVNSGIRSLAQATDIGEAWKSLLQGVGPSSRIAIKVNCINSLMATHPAVTNAVVSSLKKMSFSGTPIPENNMIIFDRTTGELRSAGYTINTSSSGVRCFGTDTSGFGYSSQTFNVAGSNQRLSKILTDTVDFLINIAVLKNHGDAGVTLCLKNHYGTCDSPGSLHNSYCNPSAAALNAVTPIRSKQKVNIIDALYGIRSGGPGGTAQFVANTLIMSADVVAADYQGRKLLADKGCTSVSYATHIDTAATTYGLGTNNPSMMDIVAIHNPSLTSVEPAGIPSEFQLHQNYPNPFNPTTRIQFTIVNRQLATLNVYDVLGRVVATLVNDVKEPGTYTVEFDARLHGGQASGLAGGVYTCELATARGKAVIKMLLAK